MTYEDIVSVLGHIDDDLAAGLSQPGRPLPDTRVCQLIDLLEPDDDVVD